jgi:hypothetical protein
MRHALVLAVIGWFGQAATAGEVDQARSLWKVGKYAEALETFRALAKKPDPDPATRDAIALGLADCLDSTGEPDQAATGTAPMPRPDALSRRNRTTWPPAGSRLACSKPGASARRPTWHSSGSSIIRSTTMPGSPGTRPGS